MTSSAPVPPQQLLGFASDLAKEAGRITKAWYGSKALAVDTKTDGSPVTEADRAAELAIRSAIHQAFPHDLVLGEEFGMHGGSGEGFDGEAAGSGRVWLVDPIDGTKSFIRSVPLYANLIAVVDAGVPSLGVINLPGVDETLSAAVGTGAFCNGERCRVSDHSGLAGAYAMTSGCDSWPPGYLDRLSDCGVTLRTWGDAYGYAMVATGRAEAMLDPVVNPWDVAAAAVIVAEAGGRFTDFRGTDRFDGGSGLGSNGLTHSTFLGVVPDEGVTR